MPVRIKKPNCILLDLDGIILRKSFAPTLSAYFLREYKTVIETKCLNEERFKPLIGNVLTEAGLDSTIPESPMEREEKLNKLYEYIASSAQRNTWSPYLIDLRYVVWFDGLKQKRLQTPVFSDAIAKVHIWRSLNIRVGLVPTDGNSPFVVTWFLSHTSYGNLINLFYRITPDIDIPLTTMAAYNFLANSVFQEDVKNILFITGSVDAGKAATEAGIETVIAAINVNKAKEAKEAMSGMAKLMPIVRSIKHIELVERS